MTADDIPSLRNQSHEASRVGRVNSKSLSQHGVEIREPSYGLHRNLAGPLGIKCRPHLLSQPLVRLRPFQQHVGTARQQRRRRLTPSNEHDVDVAMQLRKVHVLTFLLRNVRDKIWSCGTCGKTLVDPVENPHVEGTALFEKVLGCKALHYGLEEWVAADGAVDGDGADRVEEGGYPGMVFAVFKAVEGFAKGQVGDDAARLSPSDYYCDDAAQLARQWPELE